MLTIRVGLPSYDGRVSKATEDTVKSLIECGLWNIDFKKVSGTYVCKARNAAVTLDLSHKKRQTYEWDYYLSMDCDMAFGPDNVSRLIAADKDIVSMSYPGRVPSIQQYAVAGRWNTGGVPGLSNFENWMPIWATGMLRVDWVGMGACLIKRRVFEGMDHPYFRHHVVEYADCANEVSEDLSFCIGAAAAGFEVWVDMDNRAAHLGH